MNNNKVSKNKDEKNALEAKLREAQADEEKINDLIEEPQGHVSFS